MNNMQNGGIPDINSLGMGKSAGAGNNTGAKNYTSDTGNLSGKGSAKLSGKRIKVLGGIVAAFAVIVIAILLVVSSAAEREAEKVVSEYLEAYFDDDYADFSWDKYYPDELAEALESSMEEDKKEKKEDGEEEKKKKNEVEELIFDFPVVSKLDGKYKDMLVDIVREFADQQGVKLKKKDIDVSAGYIVIVNSHVEYVGKTSVKDISMLCFVIKVNGRYGVYNLSNGPF